MARTAEDGLMYGVSGSNVRKRIGEREEVNAEKFAFIEWTRVTLHNGVHV